MAQNKKYIISEEQRIRYNRDRRLRRAGQLKIIDADTFGQGMTRAETIENWRKLKKNPIVRLKGSLPDTVEELEERIEREKDRYLKNTINKEGAVRIDDDEDLKAYYREQEIKGNQFQGYNTSEPRRKSDDDLLIPLATPEQIKELEKRFGIQSAKEKTK